MKSLLSIFSLLGIVVGILGFIYPVTRRVILSLIFLLCLGLIVSYQRQKRPLRDSLLVGLLLLPIVIAAFFFQFPADIIFCTLFFFFTALFVLSMFQVVSERQKLLAAYFTFVGALIVAIALNYRAILQLVTGK